MRRLLLAALALLALAGCGKSVEVQEPDVLVSAGSGSAPPKAARPPQTDDDRRIRIEVVTHGQASDAFWATVRNGATAAARETEVSMTYRSPDTYSVERMRRLINDAVDSRPDGLVVSIPSDELNAAIRRAVLAGIPVVSINSGSAAFRRLGVLAHVGQVEERAGYAAGRRLTRDGVRRALCVNHEAGNDGLDERCRGFARALRDAGGTATVVVVDPEDPARADRGLTGAMAARRAQAVLTLGPRGADVALRVLRDRPGVELASFDLAPSILEALRMGRMRFAVDQQPYLQGYLPIVFLAQQARHGLFPAQGEVVATGPHFVTRATAGQALALSRRGIR